MIEFCRPEGMLQQGIICSVTSIPKWHLIKSIHKKDYPPEGELLGAERALRKCLEDTRRILTSDDDYADYLVLLGGNAYALRIRVRVSLERTLLYLSLRNLPYTRGIVGFFAGVKDQRKRTPYWQINTAAIPQVKMWRLDRYCLLKPQLETPLGATISGYDSYNVTHLLRTRISEQRESRDNPTGVRCANVAPPLQTYPRPHALSRVFHQTL